MVKVRLAQSLKKLTILLVSLTIFFSLKTLVYVAEQAPSSHTADAWTGGTTQIPKRPESHLTTTLGSIIIPLKTTPIYEDKCKHKDLLYVPRFVEDRKASCSNGECVQFTCENFLHGNGTQVYYGKAVAWMKKNAKIVMQDSDITKLTSNCTEYRRTRGYHLEAVDEEEANYPIAFNILMHKDVEQVERLLRTIYRPQNAYCIHIDLKASSAVMDAMRAITECFKNVFIVSKRETVVYAGYSRLQADINCMFDLVSHSIKWRYLINLAGQAFPLKTNSEMVKVLKIYNGSNDIEGIYGRRVLHGRFENEWIEQDPQTKKLSMKKTGKKNPHPPFDIDIVRGSAYGIFSRKFVEFLLTDEKAKALLRWSRTTWSPDEHYWATLHHTYSNPHFKTPGGYSGIPGEKPWLAVYAAWGGVDRCFGMWRHGVCVFGVGDLPNLLKRREFFANKFYIDSQPLALECMANWIEYKVRCPPKFDSKYYESLPFINNGKKHWER